MTFLFDLNLLIALIDPLHVHHPQAMTWFEREGRLTWATCPTVQNGVVRIVGSAAYSSLPYAPPEVAGILQQWCALPEHHFWPDEISILDEAIVESAKIASARRVTDSYLLALAVHRGGKLATFDRRLSPVGVKGGADALHLIA